MVIKQFAIPLFLNYYPECAYSNTIELLIGNTAPNGSCK